MKKRFCKWLALVLYNWSGKLYRDPAFLKMESFLSKYAPELTKQMQRAAYWKRRAQDVEAVLGTLVHLKRLKDAGTPHPDYPTLKEKAWQEAFKLFTDDKPQNDGTT